MQKIRRDPHNLNIAASALADTALGQFVVSSAQYNSALDQAPNILVEGAQGFSLGINNGFYPYVTSRECTPAQIMTDSGVPMAWLTNIIGSMRTFPIRVANRYDEDGNQIGWSGPHYSDQKEISFEDIGVKPELTTVTQLPRRVFTFSEQQIKEAVRMCQPDEIFLNFMNYVDGDTGYDLVHTINKICKTYSVKGRIKYIGYGPTYDDVKEL
jgi:adenylosuccinate synthase